MRRLAAILAVFSLLAWGAAPALAATNVELFAPLNAGKRFPLAHGSSTYDRSGSSRDVEVTVKGIRSLAGKRVTVYIAGKRVGRMLVSSAGTAHREWSTDHGQFVPFASVGSTVKIRTVSGMLVAYGSYHRHHS